MGNKTNATRPETRPKSNKKNKIIESRRTQHKCGFVQRHRRLLLNPMQNEPEHQPTNDRPNERCRVARAAEQHFYGGQNQYRPIFRNFINGFHFISFITTTQLATCYYVFEIDWNLWSSHFPSLPCSMLVLNSQ